MFDFQKFFMQQALILSKRGEFSVSPNPLVGCIIVKQGQIIGEGWHEYPGENHAEINALLKAGKNAKDSSVYVTLEPCCHSGKTLACTKALIKARIKKIFIACIDPNPKIFGKGVIELENAGIEVNLGLLKDQAIKLNHIFFYYQKNKIPYVIAKWAMSIDGMLKVQNNDSKKITNDESHCYTHNLRNKIDAILVGKNTIIDDNPSLNVRYVNIKIIKNPFRILISRNINMSLNFKIFDQKISPTIVFTSIQTSKKILKELSNKGIICIILPLLKNKKMDLHLMLKNLGEMGIISLLVEGGPKLLDSFIKNKLVNEIQVFISPVLIRNFDKKYYLPLIKEQYFIKNDYFLKSLI